MGTKCIYPSASGSSTNSLTVSKPVSFHAVSFGQDSRSTSLRRMVTVAERVAQEAPRDPLAPVVPCSYSGAVDTVSKMKEFRMYPGTHVTGKRRSVSPKPLSTSQTR